MKIWQYCASCLYKCRHTAKMVEMSSNEFEWEGERKIIKTKVRMEERVRKKAKGCVHARD